MFKTMKVFDCQDMPDDVRKAFFELFSGRASNGCFVEMSIDHSTPEATLPEDQIVQDWLVANGAEKDQLGRPDWAGEDVLVRHWW